MLLRLCLSAPRNSVPARTIQSLQLTRRSSMQKPFSLSFPSRSVKTTPFARKQTVPEVAAATPIEEVQPSKAAEESAPPQPLSPELQTILEQTRSWTIGPRKTRLYIRFSAPAREILDPIVERVVRNLQIVADLRVTGPIGLPIKRRKYTVLKSPFIDKKSREQFEIQKHTRLIVIEGDPTSVKKYMEYFKAEELSDGIAVRVLEKTFFNATDLFNQSIKFPLSLGTSPVRAASPAPRSPELQKAKELISLLDPSITLPEKLRKQIAQLESKLSVEERADRILEAERLIQLAEEGQDIESSLGREDIHEQGDEPGDWDVVPRVPGLDSDVDTEKAEAPPGEVVDDTARAKEEGEEEDAKEDAEFERLVDKMEARAANAKK